MVDHKELEDAYAALAARAAGCNVTIAEFINGKGGDDDYVDEQEEKASVASLPKQLEKKRKRKAEESDDEDDEWKVESSEEEDDDEEEKDNEDADYDDLHEKRPIKKRRTKKQPRQGHGEFRCDGCGKIFSQRPNQCRHWLRISRKLKMMTDVAATREVGTIECLYAAYHANNTNGIEPPTFGDDVEKTSDDVEKTSDDVEKTSDTSLDDSSFLVEEKLPADLFCDSSRDTDQSIFI